MSYVLALQVSSPTNIRLTFQRDCILIGDCAATMTGLNAQEVCDYNIATNMGFVTDSQAFLDSELIHGPLK